MRISLFAIAVCLFSCGYEEFSFTEPDRLSIICESQFVVVDSSVPVWAYVGTILAVDNWNKVLGKRIFTGVGFGKYTPGKNIYVTMMKDSDKNEKYLGLATSYRDDARECNFSGKVQLSTNIIPNYVATQVIEHELGHIIGLSHVNWPNCRMFPVAYNYQEICAEEVDYLKNKLQFN